MKYLATLLIAFSFSLPAAEADAFCGWFKRCKPRVRCCRIFRCCKRRCGSSGHSNGGGKYYKDPPTAPQPPAPVVTPAGVIPEPK